MEITKKLIFILRILLKIVVVITTIFFCKTMNFMMWNHHYVEMLSYKDMCSCN